MYVCVVKTKSIIKIGLFLAVLFPVYDATGYDDQVSEYIFCDGCWGDVKNGSYTGSCSFYTMWGDSADHICDPKTYYGKAEQQKSWCPTDKGCTLTCEGGMDDGRDRGPDYACGCIGGWKCTCDDNSVAAQPHQECNVAKFENSYESHYGGVKGFRAKDNTECGDVCPGWYLYRGNCCATMSVKPLDANQGPYEGWRNAETLPFDIKYGDKCGITDETETFKYFKVQCGHEYTQIDPDEPPVCKLSIHTDYPSVFITKPEDCTGCSEIKCEPNPQKYICSDIGDVTDFITYWEANCGILDVIKYKSDSTSCGENADGSGVTGSFTKNPELFVRVAENQYSNGACEPMWQNAWRCRPGYRPVDTDNKPVVVPETGTHPLFIPVSYPNFICEPCPAGTFSLYGTSCEDCEKNYGRRSTIVTEMKNGVEVVKEHTTGNVFAMACKECPKGYGLKTEYGANLCIPCGEGEYGAIGQRGSATYNICEDCSSLSTIFTSAQPNPTKGKINTSKTSCYFNAADVVLKDSLGSISLNEEIGSVNLYYQGK